MIIDLQQPVRDTKSVNLAKGGSFNVDVEYERIRKKCFHCLRLSHEKEMPFVERSEEQRDVIVGQRKRSDGASCDPSETSH